MIQGAGTRGVVGTYKAESLPNFKGSFYATNRFVPNDSINVSGPFTYNDIPAGTRGSHLYDDSEIKLSSIFFNANLANSTYQDNSHVQQEALLIQCCIKY